MADDQLTLFLSSSMSEFEEERKAVRSALKKNPLMSPFAFEFDAGARSKGAQQVWREKLAETDICMVLLGKKLGEWTQDEIDTALNLEVELLVYVKTNSEGAVHKKVEKYLAEMEDPATGRFTSARFHTVKKLKKTVYNDLKRVIKETFEANRERKVAERDEVTGSGRRLEQSEGDRGWKSDEDRPQSAGRRDPAEMRRLPRDRVPLVDRVEETGKVRRAIAAGERFVALTGQPGSGKKAILRHLTYDESFADGYGDGAGISPEQSDGEDLEDVLQAIWEEFFDPDVLGEVEPAKRKRRLRGIKALVILADVTLTAAEVDQLVEAMPDAAFLVSVAGESRPAGKRVRIGEFADPEDVVRLFEAHYHAPVPAKARSDVIELVEALGGMPGLVSMLADLAWEEAEASEDDDAAHPLIDWASKYAAMPPPDLVKALVSPDSAAAVDAARAVGVHVPDAVLSGASSRPAVEEGLADRALEAGSPRYRAAPALVDALNEAGADVDDARLMGAILESAVDWAAAADADEIFANRAFVLRMLRWGALHDEWEAVLDLGRATEEALALGGRWGSWRVALEHALAASQQLEDEHAEAWARHQLGSRALVMDDLGAARNHLHLALEQRDRLGDTAAAEVTRHNLGLVPLAVASIATLLLVLLGVAAWVVIEFFPTEWAPVQPPRAIPEIDREVVRFTNAEDSADVEIRNLGTASFKVESIDASPDILKETIREDRCTGFVIEPGGSCMFTVLATDSGDAGILDFSFVPVPAEDAAGEEPDLEVSGDAHVIVRYTEPDG